MDSMQICGKIKISYLTETGSYSKYEKKYVLFIYLHINLFIAMRE